MKTYRYLLIGLAALCCAACSRSKDADLIPETEYEMQTVPLEIRIPAAEVIKRSPGDPGSDPRLPLPDYLYIYVAVKGSSSEVVRGNTFTHIESRWEQTADKAIYKYLTEIEIPVVPDAANAEVFVLTSRQAVSLSPSYVTNVAGLESMRILPENNAQVSLRDIYYDRTDIENYGQKQTLVTAMCTHLCAKIDLTWNLTDAFRNTWRGWTVSTITVSDMPAAGYAFRPLENTVTEGGTATPYVFTTDGGNEIYGRTDTYAFQRKDGQVRWTLTFTDGKEQKEITGTYRPDLPDDVAYYRLLFTVNGLSSATDITVTDKTEEHSITENADTL